MSAIKLFTLAPGNAVEIPSSVVQLEKELQKLFEDNMRVLLGVSFVASEHPTAEGRIDTLGIDEKFRPVIIEYKRRSNENVITQGLAYRAWVKRNRDNLKWVVSETQGRKAANQLNCSSPRLICVAAEFSKNDRQSADDMDVDIELIQYRKFGSDSLLLEFLNAKRVLPNPAVRREQVRPSSRKSHPAKKQREASSTELDSLYKELTRFLQGLGPDIRQKSIVRMLNFKRRRNFACILVQRKSLKVYAALDPDATSLQEGFTRDMRTIGHYGTGDVEITLRTRSDLERAKPLLRRAYEMS